MPAPLQSDRFKARALIGELVSNLAGKTSWEGTITLHELQEEADKTSRRIAEALADMREHQPKQ